ncbi:hypothetical protein IFM89_036970 [Coptis chinensis]|uniref:UBC core domain-containing protein n=1 Tax=Coptis chinensis TaxID=261450 RepID=A0A835H875_9MAGN|nr:hypothetical protein IFM89_036970 [Coptis chinensis]
MTTTTTTQGIQDNTPASMGQSVISAKQPTQVVKTVDTQSVLKRLQSELMSLMDKWSSAYDVRTILLSIQSLLGEPNTSSPLNNQAAALWSNQEEYRKMVQKLYKPDA